MSFPFDPTSQGDFPAVGRSDQGDSVQGRFDNRSAHMVPVVSEISPVKWNDNPDVRRILRGMTGKYQSRNSSKHHEGVRTLRELIIEINGKNEAMGSRTSFSKWVMKATLVILVIGAAFIFYMASGIG